MKPEVLTQQLVTALPKSFPGADVQRSSPSVKAFHALITIQNIGDVTLSEIGDRITGILGARLQEVASADLRNGAVYKVGTVKHQCAMCVRAIMEENKITISTYDAPGFAAEDEEPEVLSMRQTG